MSKNRDWRAIRQHYEAGHTMRQCQARFGLSDWEWHEAVGRGDVVPRSGRSSATSSERRAAIAAGLAEGRSYAEIAAELDVAKSTVAYHARRLGRPVNDKCALRYDWDLVQEAIDAGATRLECIERFGFSSYAWNEAARDGRIMPRDHRLAMAELLVQGRRTNRSYLKQRLFEAGLKEPRCEICGIDGWRGEPLSLALHHVNGDGADNRLENLQLLCPNCHAQTPNFSGRNRGAPANLHGDAPPGLRADRPRRGPRRAGGVR